MPQGFDPDAFMAKRRPQSQPTESPAPDPSAEPAPAGGFDPDAFMKKRRQPPPAPSPVRQPTAIDEFLQPQGDRLLGKPATPATPGPKIQQPKPAGPVRQQTAVDKFLRSPAQKAIEGAAEPLDPQSRERVRVEQIINRTTGETPLIEDVRNRLVGGVAKGFAAVPEAFAGIADALAPGAVYGGGPGMAPPSVKEQQNLQRAGATPQQSAQILNERQRAQSQQAIQNPVAPAVRRAVTEPAERAIDAVVPTDPGVDATTGARGFFQRDLPQGIGSMVPFIAAGAAGRAAGAPKTATALFGALQNMQQATRDYDASGRSPDGRRQLTAAVAALIGSTEALGMGRIIEKFGGRQALTKRLLEAGEEGIQEYASQVLNDINAGYIGGYDPSRAQGLGILYSPEALKSFGLGATIGVGAQLASAGAESRASAAAAPPMTGPRGFTEFPKQTQITPKSELEATGRRLAREEYQAKSAKPAAPVPPTEQPAGQPGAPTNPEFDALFKRLSRPGGKSTDRARDLKTLAATPEFAQFAADFKGQTEEQQATAAKSLPEDFKKAMAAAAPPLGPPSPTKSQTKETARAISSAENLQSAVDLANEAGQRATELRDAGDFRGSLNELARQQQALREQISNTTEKGKAGQRARADLNAQISNITYQIGEIRQQEREAKRAEKQAQKTAQTPLAEQVQPAEPAQVTAPAPPAAPEVVERPIVPREEAVKAKSRAGSDVEVFPAGEAPEYDPDTQKAVTFRGRDKRDYVAVVPKSMRTRDAETFGKAKTPEAAPLAPKSTASPQSEQRPAGDLFDKVVNPEGGIPTATEAPVEFKSGATKAPEQLPDLTKFVIKEGGIKPSTRNAGELRQVGTKEAGGKQIGVLNKKGIEADEMRRRAIEAGYGTDDTLRDESQFLQKLQDDAAGRKVTSSNQEYDIEYEYKRSLKPQERAETEAFDKFLDDPEGTRAYDRVTGGDTSSEAITELESTLSRYGLGYDIVELFANEGRRAAAERSEQTAPAEPVPAAPRATEETDAKRTAEVEPQPATAQQVEQKRTENEEPPVGREETTRDEVQADAEEILARDPRQVRDEVFDSYIDELKQIRDTTFGKIPRKLSAAAKAEIRARRAPYKIGGVGIDDRIDEAMAERQKRIDAGRLGTREKLELDRDRPLIESRRRIEKLAQNPELYSDFIKAGRGDETAAQRFLEGAQKAGFMPDEAREMLARKRGDLAEVREVRGPVEEPAAPKADYVVDASKIPVKSSSEGYDIFGHRVSDEAFKSKAADLEAEANRRFDEEDRADGFEWKQRESPSTGATYWHLSGPNIKMATGTMGTADRPPSIAHIEVEEWQKGTGTKAIERILSEFQRSGFNSFTTTGQTTGGQALFAKMEREGKIKRNGGEGNQLRYDIVSAEQQQTVSHPNPEIDGKPILTTLDDGRVVVPNPENKDGVSRVKPDRVKPEEKGPMIGPNAPEKFEGGGFKVDDKVLIKEGKMRIKGTVTGVMRDGRVQVRDDSGDVRPYKPEQLEQPGQVPRTLSPEESAVEKLRSMRARPQPEVETKTAEVPDTRPTADLNLENAPQAVKDAVARLKDIASGKRAGSGGQALADQAIVTGYQVYKAGMKFAEWAKAVTKQVGAKVRPYLKAAWDKLQAAGVSVGPLESDKNSKGQILSANPIFNPDAYKQVGADIKEFVQSRLRRGQTGKDLLPMVTPNAKGNSAAMQAGVRKESLEWLNLPKFLQENPNATRADIEAYINENEPQISVKSMKSASQELGATTELKTDTLRMEGPATNYREVAMIWDNPPEGTKFMKEEHYGKTPNVLFDTRLEDRETTDGKNGSFFLEGQSDWSQASNSPETPFRNSWQSKIAEYVIGDAVKRGMDGILIPRTAQQVAEIQRWGKVEERDGRWFNRAGYDVTPIVKRYLKEWPKLFEKIGGAKLETKTIDVGHGQTEEVSWLPLQQSPAQAAPAMRIQASAEPGPNYWETKPLPMGPDGKPQDLTPTQIEDQILQSRAEFRAHKTRGRLYANDQGTTTYAAVMKAAKPGSITETSVDGIAIPISTAGDMLLYLKGNARSHPSQQRRALYNTLIPPLEKAINYALDNGKPSIVLANTDAGVADMKARQFRPSLRTVREVVAHEETHSFQFEVTANKRGQGLGLFDNATITSDPDYQQQRDALLQQKYSKEYLDPQGVSSEAMAFVVSGQWDRVGYKNEADAVKYLERTFERIYDQYGADALNQLRVRTRAARGAKENVRAARNRSRELDADRAGIAGRASQGQSGSTATARRPPPATDTGVFGGAQEGPQGGVASTRPNIPPTPPQKPVNPYLAMLQEESERKSTRIEKASALRKVGPLGSIPTHLRNIFGNVIEQGGREVSAAPAALADAIMSAATGRRTTAGVNPLAMARAGREGGAEGLKKAKRIIRSGANVDEALEAQREEVKFDNPILQKYTQFIGRALSAEDALFKSYALQRALENRARAQALTEARQKLITRDQIKQRTRELIANPPNDLAAGAHEDSLTAVFQNENWLSDAVQRFRRGLPPAAQLTMDMLLPYDKTPTNIIARAIEYSPAGFALSGGKALGAVGRLAKGAREQRKAGLPTRAAIKASIDEAITPEQQKSIAEIFGKATVGTGLMALGYALASAGVMTGFYDEEDKSAETRNRTMGKQPMALNLGGRSYQIGSLGPLGLIMATGATLYREKNRPLKDESKRTDRMIGAATNVISQVPFLEAGKQANEMLKGPGSYAERAGRVVASAIPSVGGIGKLTDPYDREAKGFTGSIMGQIPGVRRFLPVKKDAQGKEIEPGYGARALGLVDPFSSKEIKSTPLLDKMEQLGMGFGKPVQKPGEPENLFKARVERADAWFDEYGRTLAAHPEFQTLSEKQQKAALTRLRQSINLQSNRKEPELDKFDAKTIVEAIRSGEEKKQVNREKRLETDIYVPQ